MYLPNTSKPVHLVKNFDEIPAAKRLYPMVAQEKHDGCYGFGVISKGDYQIISRTGKSVFGALRHMSAELQNMHETRYADFGPVMLIFEIKGNKPDGTPMSAAAIAGRCQDESLLFPEAFAVVHDCIPYSDFVKWHCPTPYTTRHSVAVAIAEKLSWSYCRSTLVNNEEEARDFAQYIINKGGEGAVFKQPDGEWVAGKKDWRMLKIKQDMSYDLRVIGVREGEGKYAGTTGTIVCRWRRFGKADGELVELPISGMGDKQRDSWWECPDRIIGCIVQVDAMRFTEFGMLREPRFKGVRFDKTEADVV